VTEGWRRSAAAGDCTARRPAGRSARPTRSEPPGRCHLLSVPLAAPAALPVFGPTCTWAERSGKQVRVFWRAPQGARPPGPSTRSSGAEQAQAFLRVAGCRRLLHAGAARRHPAAAVRASCPRSCRRSDAIGAIRGRRGGLPRSGIAGAASVRLVRGRLGFVR
jgi:hypothetical protein